MLMTLWQLMKYLAFETYIEPIKTSGLSLRSLLSIELF